jgi:hypothetical protein
MYGKAIGLSTYPPGSSCQGTGKLFYGEYMPRTREQLDFSHVQLHDGGGERMHSNTTTAGRMLRKATGVYYTPAYIVRFIVHHTLHRLLKGKTPQQIALLRILDPSCGEGAFLLGAYRYLLDWHQRWYLQHGSRILTTAERLRILRAHIFGVDIDRQALARARAALTRHALGTECPELNGKPSGDHEPTGGENIEPHLRCGNALIGPDFRGNADQKTAHPFDWHAEFVDIMSAGGFDVVIGNPPYRAVLSAAARAYLADKFAVATTDTAALLMVQAHRLTRPGGWNGFIVPKPFTYSSNWTRVRDFLTDELAGLVDAGKAWPEVKLEQVIYFLQKGRTTGRYRSFLREGEAFRELAPVPKSACRVFGFYLNGITPAELALARKMHPVGTFLSDFTTNVRGGMLQRRVRQSGGGFRAIGGKQIRPFCIQGQKGFLSARPSHACAGPRSILVQNIVAHIARPRPHIQIIGAVVPSREARHLALLDTVNQLRNHSPLSSHYLLAVLSSRLLNWYVYHFIFARAIRTLHFDGPVSRRVPIPELDLTNRKDRRRHGQLTSAAQALASLSRRHAPAARLARLRERIDELVYEIFGLTAAEIRIVED